MQRSDDRDQNSHGSRSARDRRSTAETSARATTQSKPQVRHAWRSLVLGWSDPESGDELTLDVRGGAEFARGLAGMGFEILAEPDPGQEPEVRRGVIEVVAQQRSAGATRRIGDRSDKFARPWLRERRSAPPG
jgi:hypothetical protein